MEVNERSESDMFEPVDGYLRQMRRRIVKGAIFTFLIAETVIATMSWGVIEAVTSQHMSPGLLFNLAGVVTPLACVVVFLVAGAQLDQAIRYMPAHVAGDLWQQIPVKGLLARIRRMWRHPES
jgi:hypothetical protein